MSCFSATSDAAPTARRFRSAPWPGRPRRVRGRIVSHGTDRIRTGARDLAVFLLSTFDRTFAPRTDRKLPRANRVGATMRLGTGVGALIPGSRDGQCAPHSGPQKQCADCTAETPASIAAVAFLPLSIPRLRLLCHAAPTGAVAVGSVSASGASTAAAARAPWPCAACALLNAANANMCVVCNAALHFLFPVTLIPSSAVHVISMLNMSSLIP
jgi:hypothetical protein